MTLVDGMSGPNRGVWIFADPEQPRIGLSFASAPWTVPVGGLKYLTYREARELARLLRKWALVGSATESTRAAPAVDDGQLTMFEATA